MNRNVLAALCALIVLAAAPAPSSAAGKGAKPVVLLQTSLGNIKLELYPDKAPVSVANFLAYVREKHYDGLTFHRVIRTFMIQGGGFTPDMKERRTTRPAIKNEAGNGLKNSRGTIAMARTSVVDSATAQFFINVVDNPPLDHVDETPRGFGYAVFGRVVEGMDVVEKIREVPTGRSGMHQDVPREPVTILKAVVVSESERKAPGPR